MQRHTTTTLLALAGFALPSTGAFAQCEVDRLSAGDLVSREFFGSALSMSGTRAIVGANYGETGHGSAYIFDWTPTGWVESAKLTASDGALFDYFGQAVGLSGDTAFIGARGAAADQGAVYVFENGAQGWVQCAKLTASDSAPNAGFGVSVTVDGDIAAIGVPNDDVMNAHGVLKAGVGSVYVFERTSTGWAETAKLTASDLDTTSNSQYDKFGTGVALSQGRLLVGAAGDEGTGSTNNTGSAYVFERTPAGWIEATKIPGEVPAGQFGHRVALEDDVAIIGARKEFADGQDSLGAAYIFERQMTGWSLVSRLAHPNPMPGDLFGTAVALSGSTAVVGALNDDDVGEDSGSAFVFERTSAGWELARKLVAGDGASDDYFGTSVAVSGGVALVGAHGADTAGNDSGTVYVIDLNGPGQVSSFCTGAPNSAGPGAVLSQHGSLSIGGNQFIVHVDGAIPGQSATLFYSATQAQMPFGDGVLCLGTPAYRVEPAVTITANGFQEIPFDFTQPPADSGPGMIAPGSTWNFQVWYRDPAGGGAFFNLTDGLAVTFCP